MQTTKSNLNGTLGPLFPPTVKFVGQLVFGVGVLSLLFIPLVGLFLFLSGSYVGFGVTGVLIRPEDATYQYYTGLFGLRFGKFQSYCQYPYLSVLRTKVTSSAFSMTNRNAITGSDLYYDVYFLNQSHRERILIRRYKNQFDAKQSAQELGNLLSKEVVMYNPKVSAATMRRR